MFGRAEICARKSGGCGRVGRLCAGYISSSSHACVVMRGSAFVAGRVGCGRSAVVGAEIGAEEGG